MALDEAQLRRIKSRADEALGDLPQAGLVGLAAIRGAARAHERLAALDLGNAKETLADLRATQRELDMLVAAFAKGLHKDAFNLALGRTQTIVHAAVRDLATGLGEAP
jgi:hypothetical protein